MNTITLTDNQIDASVDTTSPGSAGNASFNVIDPAWRSKARCADGNGTLTPLFFSEDLFDIARAKAVCSNCSVTQACLAEALEAQEPWGVWGGQLLVNGRILAAKRRRGRPPKCGRAEALPLVVDEDGRILEQTA